MPHDERREIFVEIRTKAPDDQERVVTTIEVLSLANKTPGEKGRDLYLRKQREVLDGDIHLVEIDLLRGGTHTTAAPRWRIENLQAVFNRCYEVGPYHRRLKYDTSRIVPPLSAKQLRWVKQRLRDAKLV